MNIFKKYVIISSSAVGFVILFVLFAPIDWNEIQTPLNQRMQLIQDCIDNDELTARECSELYPVDNVMTRPIINTTGWFD